VAEEQDAVAELVSCSQQDEQESLERSVCLPGWASVLQLRLDARD